MNSDIVQFKGQYCVNDKSSPSYEHCKDEDLNGFYTQKYGRKNKETLSFSKQVGGRVIFYCCEINLHLSYLQGECGNSKRHNVERLFQYLSQK